MSSRRERDHFQHGVVRYATRRIEFKLDMIDKYDKDKSKSITKLELDENQSLTDRESYKKFLMKHDVNKDGKVTLDEIWEVYKKELDLDFTKEEEEMIMVIYNRFLEVQKVFEDLDEDDSGYLTMGECYNPKTYKDGCNDDSLDNIINIFTRIDKDPDYKIKLDELWKYFLVVDFPDIPGEMDMRKAFRKFDKNNDGKLCDHEIRDALKNAKYSSPDDIQVLYRTVDKDGDEKISIEEFIDQWKAMLRNKTHALKGMSGHRPEVHWRVLRYSDRRIHLREYFIDPFDTDKSGTVNRKELNAYSDTLSDEDLHEFQSEKNWIMDHDSNKDGEMTLDEMWTLYKKNRDKHFTKEEDEMIVAISNRYFEVKKFFNECDKDKNGVLTWGECYEHAGYKEDCEDNSLANILNIFTRIDTRQTDDKLTLKEFWRYFEKVDFPDIAGEIKMRECFRKFDKNGDGKIGQKKINEILKDSSNRSSIDLHVLYNACDSDGDGKISMDEFINTWRYMMRDQTYPEINRNKRQKTCHH